MKQRGWHFRRGHSQLGRFLTDSLVLPRTRGQSSLEALISFAALLAALSILIFSASRLSGEFAKSAEDSRQRTIVSERALSLDTAASLPCSSFSFNASLVPSAGGAAIASGADNGIYEPLFSRVTGGQGGIYVQGKIAEPV